MPTSRMCPDCSSPKRLPAPRMSRSWLDSRDLASAIHDISRGCRRQHVELVILGPLSEPIADGGLKMPVDVIPTSQQKFVDLLGRGEGHFLDFKSKTSAPGRLTKTLSAFANADGGELFIGVEDGGTADPQRWRGFTNVEEANGFIQAFGEFFPLGNYFRYKFLRSEGLPGVILHCEVMKTPDIRKASDARIYLRRSAQSIPQDTEEKLTRLKFNKGISSYEDHVTNVSQEEVTNSAAIIEFLLDVVPDTEPVQISEENSS